MKTPKPHQERALVEMQASYDSGVKAACVTSPTGGGKSFVVALRVKENLQRQRKTMILTPRKALTEQWIKGLNDEGITFGVRAADFDDYYNPYADVQIAAVDTEIARVLKGKNEPFPCDELIPDEAHLFTAGAKAGVCDLYRGRGANEFGFTATPLGVKHRYESLIIAGTNSELRACGLHVPAWVIGGEEIDSSKLKPSSGEGEFSQKEVADQWHQQRSAIFGFVLPEWERWALDENGNRTFYPTIAFAPDVPSSVWLAQQFELAGYPFAHVDGDDVYMNGKRFRANRTTREDLWKRLRDGELCGISNRFVCREGIDLPFLRHCILATVIGSRKSYLQTVGRVIRAHGDEIDHVVIQDHGGNWWRHGSPNEDRNWHDEWLVDERVLCAARLEELRSGELQEPGPCVCGSGIIVGKGRRCPRCKDKAAIHCASCGAERPFGVACPQCGYQTPKPTRKIIQENGELEVVEGPIVKPRKRVQSSQWAKGRWDDCVHATINSGGTFAQAEGLFVHRHHSWPPRGLPLQPVKAVDWFKRVALVSSDRLTSAPDYWEKYRDGRKHKSRKRKQPAAQAGAAVLL